MDGVGVLSSLGLRLSAVRVGAKGFRNCVLEVGRTTHAALGLASATQAGRDSL